MSSRNEESRNPRHKGKIFPSRARHKVLAQEAARRFKPPPELPKQSPPPPIDWPIKVDELGDRILRALAAKPTAKAPVLGQIQFGEASSMLANELPVVPPQFVLPMCKKLIDMLTNGELKLESGDWIPISMDPKFIEVIAPGVPSQRAIVCIEAYKPESQDLDGEEKEGDSLHYRVSALPEKAFMRTQRLAYLPKAS
jgi:hypothetical protein